MVVFKSIVRFLFRFSGWTIQGEIPKELKKAVFVGAPHTSNWDLFYTLGLMYTLDINFRFLIKKEALVFPIKGFLTALGAYPVDRKKIGTNYVDQIANVFKESDQCFLCIAPEGTRRAVKKWKSGFYHIAKKAQVPIVAGYINVKEKVVYVGYQISTECVEAEAMEQLKNIMKNAVPVNPKNFAL